MGLSVPELLASMKDESTGKILPWLYDVVCKLDPTSQRNFDRALLGGIYLKLSEISRSSAFGSNYFRITPVQADTTPQKIIERDTRNLVRKVSVWVDAASGGPTPTIRISTSGAGTSTGGIRVNAGQVNVIGEVPPNQELWIASTTALNCYIVEVA